MFDRPVDQKGVSVGCFGIWNTGAESGGLSVESAGEEVDGEG